MKKLSLLLVLFCCSALTYAQIRLPQIIRDSMILQRGTNIKIWGWASSGEKISVTFNGKTSRSRAAKDGGWEMSLPPMKAGGPYTMEIRGKNKIVLHDILIGDVWFCAGQSNMVHQIKLHSVYYPDAIPTANYPQIRQFWVPNTTNLTGPQKDLPFGSWKWANPENVKDFSAVAYFFARDLFEKYHIPIGIINASWGGIPIESMMSEESLKPFAEIYNTIEKNKDTAYVNGVNRKAAMEEKSIKVPEDRGMIEKWYSPAYQPEGWHRIAIPGFWADEGAKNLNGVVWYRNEIDVPASIANSDAKVFLGRIVDADELYINGVKVGSTGYMYPQRRYPVPQGILKPGKNLFVVRITNNFGKGGFVPDKPYELIGGKDTIQLTGYWQYKAGRINELHRGRGTFSIALQYQPTALYNTMIAPLTSYGIKGFVWYQGESNTGNPDLYAKLQPAMISDWRRRWNEGNLPFLFVQLPGFGDYSYLPVASQMALFREAQAKSLSVPNTAMAVAIDLGEWNDVHPDRKNPVGNRLALAAEKIAYAENNVYAGPLYDGSKIEGDKIIISFTNTGAGLTTNDGEPPAEFAIAGEDKKFVWATAKIEGDKIVVSGDKVSHPKYVRYAWADTPVNPNLFNVEGLPAAPFRTDE